MLCPSKGQSISEWIYEVFISPKIRIKKLSGFLPSLHRAEILTIFCSYFGRNDGFISPFWNWLTFSISTWLAAVQSHKPVSLSKIINEMVKKSPNVGCNFLFLSMFEGLEMVKMFIEMSFYFALDTLNGSSTFFGS